MTNTEVLLDEIRRVQKAFSPTAPINSRDLFAGRIPQMIALMDAVDQTGQHVALYGERGVGKTSLSAVASDMLGGADLTVKINCQSNDTFSVIWTRAFSEITFQQRVSGTGFGSSDVARATGLIDHLGLPPELTADHVRMALNFLTAQRPVVIFFDEFDRVEDPTTHRAFADTIKTLSDQAVAATIVIVGVADDVSQLVKEHASVERALAQINMPRMSTEELAEIVTKGLASVDMTVSKVALGRITRLSQGLPHYTHLLAQQAGVSAVQHGRKEVSTADVEVALSRALERAQESIADLYYRATYSPREKNLYKEVLLACAMAKADDRGFFAATAVRESLSEVLGKRVEIPSFAGHLNTFASDRGPVLDKHGTQRKFRYRFTTPLLQPYVLMRGLADGVVDPTILDA